jgi:hypothetical protein
VAIQLFLSKFYARKNESLSSLTFYYNYGYLAYGEHHAELRAGIEGVLHATEELRSYVAL